VGSGEQIAETIANAAVVSGAVHELPTEVLLDRVVDEGYQGSAWRELQARIASHTLDDLTTSLATGSIVARCAALGYRLQRDRSLQREPLPNEIASEAVSRGLGRLKEKILIPGAWDPHRGQSLEDFFTVCCLSDVVNVYRWHQRRRRREASLDRLVDEGDLRLAKAMNGPEPDPAIVVGWRQLLTETLESLQPDDRQALVLEANGWSRAEIAEMLDLLGNTLDARISRARRRLGDRPGLA
jgi:hypothetical protein